jgi:uncharacterized protein (TIGR02147 family)
MNDNNFLHYLHNELESRCQQNKMYSLRAFAKSLDVEPSFLSKLLNQKRPLTKNSIYRFGTRLGLSPEGIKPFIDALYEERQLIKAEKNKDLQGISEDEFRAISQWYHFAILELTKCDDFVSEIGSMASKLGINYGECLAGVNRLKRLGMLLEKKGTLVCNDNYTTTNNLFTNEAFKTMQRQICDQAKMAIDEIAFEERLQSSMTMAIDVDQLEKAQKMIKKFRRELTKILETDSKRDKVYQLSISLFPVSHTR